MCSPLADIGAQWTDEEVFFVLAKIINGFPHPSNVYVDINPYEYKPENLPGDIWYLVDLKDKKEAEAGSWRAKGDPCQIFANPAICGWRTTFEFYEGKASHASRTNWLMQEYRIFQKGTRETIEMKVTSLCRVFVLDGKIQCHDKQNLAALVEDSMKDSHQMQVLRDVKKNSGCNSTNKFQVKKEENVMGVVGKSDDRLEPLEIKFESNSICEGDYLELDDLESSFFSSENSSCGSISSDEWLNSSDLLHELESDMNRGSKNRNGDCMFNVSTFQKLNQIIFCPATTGCRQICFAR